jgi:hypothetical protein
MKNLVLLAGLTGLAWAPAVAADGPVVSKSLPHIPFSFQQAGNGTWMAHGVGCRVGVDSSGATIATGAAQIRMSFSGARGDATATPEDPLPGKFNYLIGADPKRWIRDVPTFGRVRYHDVYDGVDVAWYGGDRGLEYDLAVTPGADTSRIAVRFEGAEKLAVEAGGDLRIETAAGPLTMRVPVVYQEGAGGRTRVEARYVLSAGNEVGFELAKYDKSRPLVIDPTLVYAAWFDSQGVTVTSMARDTQGNMYVGGDASWLPTVNAVQGDFGYSDPFVIKFDPTGTTMLYATFVGGTSGDLTQWACRRLHRKRGRYGPRVLQQLPHRQSGAIHVRQFDLRVRVPPESLRQCACLLDLRIGLRGYRRGGRRRQKRLCDGQR